MQTRTLVAILVTVIGACFIAYQLRKNKDYPIPEPEIVIVRDTVIDTVTVIKPVPVESRVVDSLLAAIAWKDLLLMESKTDTITVHDSVYIQLPIEQKVYSDSTYYAVVSGYKPNLDYLRIAQRTVIETRTVTKDYSRWGISATAGYGAALDGNTVKLMPTLSIGVDYSLIRFRRREKK